MKYIVTVFETWGREYEVEANSVEQAKDKFEEMTQKKDWDSGKSLLQEELVDEWPKSKWAVRKAIGMEE